MPDVVIGEPEILKTLGTVAATLVTVPELPEAAMVWLGHVPVTVMFVPATMLGVAVAVPPFATGSKPVTPVVSGRPVRFVATPDVGVPNKGVTNVGEVANTAEPVPVSSVKAESKFALLGVAKKVATPVPRPLTPVLIGKPVAFVKVPLVGVPRIGVTRVGLVANTKAPEPVSSVIAEAKLALEGVAKRVATPVPKPLTPVEIGKPVALVNVALVGVPRIGVTSVGEFDNTTLVVPVLVVTPVPPFATPNVPVMSAVERLTASQEALVPSV